MSDWPDPATNWEFYDPFLGALRHPQLPAGMNTTSIDGDMMDGPGVNAPVWPLVFNTFEAFAPVLLTADHMDTFNEIPDLAIPATNSTVVFPREIRSTQGGT